MFIKFILYTKRAKVHDLHINAKFVFEFSPFFNSLTLHIKIFLSINCTNKYHNEYNVNILEYVSQSFVEHHVHDQPSIVNLLQIFCGTHHL